MSHFFEEFRITTFVRMESQCSEGSYRLRIELQRQIRAPTQLFDDE